MFIPRFWTRAAGEATTPEGKAVPVFTWAGSRSSRVEAEAIARARLERIIARVQRGDGFPERYAYGERPLREEILQEYVGSGTELVAAVTRNSYGVLVLNTARVVFIDVDLPKPRDPSPLLGRFLRWILRRPAPVLPDPSVNALERLRQWLERHPSWGARVYRTHSGLRYLLTHGTYSPEDAEIATAMDFLHADPQYRRLCRAQKSFRARLTPKPWRLDMEPPPYRCPWHTAEEKHAMHEWQQRHEQATQGLATCRFVEAQGNPRVHPEIGPFLQLHDAYTGSESSLPLA